MTRAIVLQHVDFEGPARLAGILAGEGYDIEIRPLHRGAAVPDGIRREDLLVVMGGPMGVGDRHLPRCSFLEDEIRLLRRRADEDSPVLGICLGAQLLAHAAGARVYPMSERRGGTPSYEVGWSPVRFHARDGNDAQIMMSTSEMHVLHWHGDTFDLPANAELLASSAICHNQAFRLKRRLFGLQFHCEVDKEHVEAFLREDADFVIRANGADGVAELRAHTARTIDESRTAGDALLKNIVRIMAGP